ncbi:MULTISPECIES: helix-turn-helix domain-containing protein [Bacillales]|uniref:helix-turn-helix domain-containing protein n=1 Tax=Bacillales TaxID=1385 RepID=UPI0026587E4F|nr:helix-turn-helix transcriptional regulator [Paenibacillus sp. 11B]
MPYLLAKRKIKATDLAKELNLSDGFISQVISGKKFFSYQNAAHAARILNCTMEELHEWDD